MSAIYIVEQNTKIRIQNRRLQVEKDQENAEPEVLISYPLSQVDQMVLFGNIGLTTPAIGMLLDQECEVTFLTVDGNYRGKLVSPLTPHVPIRRAQYACLSDSAFVLKTAKGFVTAKLSHQRALLMRHRADAADPEDLERSIRQLALALAAVASKTELSSLRGLEGSATAAYFRGLRSFFHPDWNFHDRNRRPPADPVNVLLSLGYTLMASRASSAVQTVGLDPYAGFLHEIVYNRPALALDLMEEFRPVVDGVVLWCCRANILSPRDFLEGPAERPVVLSDQGKRAFLQAWEQRMGLTFTHPIRQQKLPLRQCMIEQARQIASRVTENQPGYQGMGFR